MRIAPSIAAATLFSEQIRVSRAPSAPRSGFALGTLIYSAATVAVAIDGAKITRSYEFDLIHKADAAATSRTPP
jgi:hypothetical protein